MRNNCCGKVDSMNDEEANGDKASHLPKPKVVLFPVEKIQLGWRDRQLSVGSGLTNTGVICYINSTLQALFHIPAFSNWLMNDKEHQNACQQKTGVKIDCIVCAVRDTFTLSQKHTGSSFKASMITNRLSLICKDLSTRRQEDAHEFLCYLIESMGRSYLSVSGHADKSLDVYSKETTPVNQIFGGYMRTEVTCRECENISTTFQHFQDLILDIKQSDNVPDALNNYFVGEQLSYVCGKCQREVVAEKKFSIEKAPNVLCVQLKRHDIGMDGSNGRKINKSIKINERLDLSGYTFGTDVRPLRYHLVSMILHSGRTLNSGHYVTIGLTTSGSYYCFNDSDVYQTSFDKYSRSTDSYILFYELDPLKNELSKQVPEKYRPKTETLGDKTIMKTWNNGRQGFADRKVEQRKNNQLKRTRDNDYDENFDRGIVKKKKYDPEESWLQTLCYHPVNQNNGKMVKSVITWPNRSVRYRPYYNNGYRHRH